MEKESIIFFNVQIALSHIDDMVFAKKISSIFPEKNLDDAEKYMLFHEIGEFIYKSLIENNEASNEPT